MIFVHCLREVNRVAYEMARYSFINKKPCNWSAKSPNSIVSKLIDDIICVGNQ